jgi:hypothetical protein
VRTKIPDMGGAVGASAKSANSAAEGPLGTAVAHITAAANGKCASIASCQLPATGTVEQVTGSQGEVSRAASERATSSNYGACVRVRTSADPMGMSPGCRPPPGMLKPLKMALAVSRRVDVYCAGMCKSARPGTIVPFSRMEMHLEK